MRHEAKQSKRLRAGKVSITSLLVTIGRILDVCTDPDMTPAKKVTEITRLATLGNIGQPLPPREPKITT